ncbi:hypothetical protein CMI37_34120, partial [Candidatus Pacearchaeota archaeon]|nr:hypothetical protein [Candidatus Pacearchaeota archaeon]
TASFTTADETKLDGIEAAATADQTGAEIASALSGEAVTGLTNLESDVLTLKGYKAQAWEARFQINSGVIKHQIGAVGASTTAGSWHDKVLNASQSLITTPNGADASTAFSGGAKISGTSPNILIFDTADQGAIADAFLLVATADYDTNGVNISFRAGFTSRDVDGVTIFRPEVQVRDDSGAAFNINTTNLATGADRVTMQFIGYLA